MIPDRIEGAPEEWLVEQRWFASKARDVAEVNELARFTLTDDLHLVLVEARFAEGTHELYQLLRGGPGAADALGGLLRTDAVVGDVHFHGSGRPDGHARGVGAEQSNSSVIYGDRDVLKLFRRLEPGDNPELEMVRYLTARGFANIAELTGHYELRSELMDATLGVMQAYVPEGRDGWEVALDDPEGLATRIAELGTATGLMHSALGSEAIDPDFAPEEPSIEALSLLTATIDEQIERAFRDLPDGLGALQPIAGRGEELRDRLQLMSHVGVGGRLIRQHGDFHLGQTLLAGGVGGGTDSRWVILDFEGEPARPLLERRRKRSPLRDVAGMMRSFAYAASAAALLRNRPTAPDWEQRVRTSFLDAYFEAVEPGLLPAGRAATEKLLAIFELDKAVYELRYELNNRPDWVAIPVAGIARLLDEDPASSGGHHS